jgi:hypothetical protein
MGLYRTQNQDLLCLGWPAAIRPTRADPTRLFALRKAEGSQRRQTVKFGHETPETRTKNHCAGEGQRQFSSQCLHRVVARLPGS